MELILGLLIGVINFIVMVVAYILGLNHGKQLINGIVPKLHLNPVSAIAKTIQQHKQGKEDKRDMEELEDIFSYTKESAMEAIKKEVK